MKDLKRKMEADNRAALSSRSEQKRTSPALAAPTSQASSGISPRLTRAESPSARPQLQKSTRKYVQIKTKSQLAATAAGKVQDSRVQAILKKVTLSTEDFLLFEMQDLNPMQLFVRYTRLPDLVVFFFPFLTPAPPLSPFLCPCGMMNVCVAYVGIIRSVAQGRSRSVGMQSNENMLSKGCQVTPPYLRDS